MKAKIIFFVAIILTASLVLSQTHGGGGGGSSFPVKTSVAVTSPGSITFNTGTTLTMSSGSTLTCAAGSTCPGTVTSSGSPVAGNIAKFTTATNVAPAAATDIVNLFSTCSGTQYLGADGACHNAGAAGVTNVVLPSNTFSLSSGCTGGPNCTATFLTQPASYFLKSAAQTTSYGSIVSATTCGETSNNVACASNYGVGSGDTVVAALNNYSGGGCPSPNHVTISSTPANTWTCAAYSSFWLVYTATNVTVGTAGALSVAFNDSQFSSYNVITIADLTGVTGTVDGTPILWPIPGNTASGAITTANANDTAIVLTVIPTSSGNINLTPFSSGPGNAPFYATLTGSAAGVYGIASGNTTTTDTYTEYFTRASDPGTAHAFMFMLESSGSAPGGLFPGPITCADLPPLQPCTIFSYPWTAVSGAIATSGSPVVMAVPSVDTTYEAHITDACTASSTGISVATLQYTNVAGSVITQSSTATCATPTDAGFVWPFTAKGGTTVGFFTTATNTPVHTGRAKLLQIN